ncbi:MAG: helix-turn-helix domain-containing protein [Terasakiella sp.]|uniref:helix-turn-helix domain-containing protein n=1 Tax=unclassified Terasakiella TaxID=2614952 RepID=UPI003B008179
MAHKTIKETKRRKGLVYRDAIKETNLFALAGESCVKMKNVPEPSAQNHTILKGRINSRDCCSRLNVHATDSEEVRDYTAKAYLQPAVTFSIILKGRIEGMMGDTPFILEADSRPTGYLWSMNTPMLWTRSIKKDMYVRKVNISLPRDGLLGQLAGQKQDDPLNFYVRQLLTGPLQIHQWQPSKRAISLAEQIVQPVCRFPLLDQLYMESRALEIVSEALESMVKQNHTVDVAACASKAQSIRDYIEEHLNEDLTLSHISCAIGMAVNSTQRMFKATFDMTVMDYIRERRLEIAKTAMVQDGLTIAQAAYLAGYNSPANFSTAFKRVYGISPSSLRR